MGKPLPRWERPFGYTNATEQRKEQIMQTLRDRLAPMTRKELTEALGWPDYILTYQCKGRGIDPLLLLVEEGKVEKLREGRIIRYKADPDISKLILHRN